MITKDELDKLLTENEALLKRLRHRDSVAAIALGVAVAAWWFDWHIPIPAAAVFTASLDRGLRLWIGIGLLIGPFAINMIGEALDDFQVQQPWKKWRLYHAYRAFRGEGEQQ